MTGPASAKAFLGRGWAFPVAPAADGDVAMAEYEDDVEQAIRIILGTNRDERPMRADFGAGLDDFAFEPLSTTTAALVRQRVEEALVLWEPRIDRVEVRVHPVRPGDHELRIEIDYRVRATNTFYNLVHPFYLLEAEPS
jgi:phage baseplate assembly protein W